VEELLKTLVENTTGGVSYALIFGVLLACGLGLPLPEDVSLILGGFLVYQQKAQLGWMMLTGYLGILVGDSMIFYFGRRVGTRVGQKEGGFFSRLVTPQKRAQAEGLFKKHGEKIIFIARFLPGLRSVTYFTAGSVKMQYSHFAFFDSVAALISAPLFIFLGFRFGGDLETLINNVRRGQTRVLLVLAVIVAGYVGFRIWRSRQEKAKAAAEAAAAAAASAPVNPGLPRVPDQQP
jgi:membrane protein DedA with SNARE-associated domain